MKTLIVAALILSGCASGTLAGYQTLTNVATVGDAAVKSFEQFDTDYQKQVVQKAKAAGKDAMPELEAYRAKRSKVTKAFADAAAAVQIGYALLPLIDKGVKKSKDMSDWLMGLFEAAGRVQTALADIGVK